MQCLLDVLAAAGVPKAGTDYRWPLDVVTQILRDHAGSPLPIRDGLSAADAARMKRRLEGAETGGWLYEPPPTRAIAGRTLWLRLQPEHDRANSPHGNAPSSTWCPSVRTS